MALLSADEKAWLTPHKTLYLLGTEAPDHRVIPTSCGAPNIGYNDRGLGHSVEWNAGATTIVNDRAAVRAQEEYGKAVIAFGQGKPAHAAYFLGAMAHYIGDVSPAPQMDSLYKTKPPEFMTSVGASLNLGVNELADVLHTFFLNVVSEDDL